jgi:hypothetical protein
MGDFSVSSRMTAWRPWANPIPALEDYAEIINDITVNNPFELLNPPRYTERYRQSVNYTADTKKTGTITTWAQTPEALGSALDLFCTSNYETDMGGTADIATDEGHSVAFYCVDGSHHFTVIVYQTGISVSYSDEAILDVIDTWASEIEALRAGEIEYKTPGTYSWPVPGGVSSVDLIIVGAGGGGGGGHGRGGDLAGAGGSAGEIQTIAGVPVSGTVSITIGAGGPGGVGGYGQFEYANHPGTVGGNSSFGATVSDGGAPGINLTTPYSWAGTPGANGHGSVTLATAGARDPGSGVDPRFAGGPGGIGYGAAGGGGGCAFSANTSGGTGGTGAPGYIKISWSGYW